MKRLFFYGLLILVLSAINTNGQNICVGNISGTLYQGPGKIISVYNSEYIFCIKEDAIETYSVSDPSDPVLLNSNPLWESVNCFEVANLLGFMGSSDGLSIMDLSYPLYPLQSINFYSLGNINSVATTDSFSYIVSDSILYIFNIANFHDIEITDSIRIADNCLDIKVAGNYAFIACDSSGLVIADIGDPENISIIDTILTEWPVSTILIKENYAYVLEYFNFYPVEDSRLVIFDISNPSQPTQMGILPFMGIFDNIAIRQNIAFVGGAETILSDVSNPQNPVIIDSISELYWVNDIKISDTIGYTADINGLHVLNVTDGSSPQIIANIPAFFQTEDVFVQGNYAYVASAMALYIVDIFDPFLPMYKGGCLIDGFQGKEIYVSGDSAYIASFSSGTIVLNITDPTNPYRAGRLPSFASGASRGICIKGQYAYESGSNLGLRIISLVDSSVTEFSTPGTAWNVEVVGDYAYIADTDYLTIADVTDPAHPTRASATLIIGVAWDLCVSGDYVYIAALNGGLQIYNIATPNNPVFAGYYFTGDEATGVKILDHYAIVTVPDSSLMVIDVANPAHPSFVTRGYDLYNPKDLFIADDIIYVADQRSLQLYQLGSNGIANQEPILPDNLMLLGNYPNPFNSKTTFKYALSKPAQVKINIYDMLGGQVQTINSQIQPAGNHELIWNADDLASGLYFYRIQAGSYSQTRKCLLLK